MLHQTVGCSLEVLRQTEDLLEDDPLMEEPSEDILAESYLRTADSPEEESHRNMEDSLVEELRKAGTPRKEGSWEVAHHKEEVDIGVQPEARVSGMAFPEPGV